MSTSSDETAPDRDPGPTVADSALALVAEFSPAVAPGAVLRCLARCHRGLVLSGAAPKGDPGVAAIAMARAKLAERSSSPQPVHRRV